MHAEMMEAACEVMISQQILLKFADGVLLKLKQSTRQAEERGFDIAAPCDAGNEQACNYYDAVLLYQRVLADARALQLPRILLSDASDF